MTRADPGLEQPDEGGSVSCPSAPNTTVVRGQRTVKDSDWERPESRGVQGPPIAGVGDQPLGCEAYLPHTVCAGDADGDICGKTQLSYTRCRQRTCPVCWPDWAEDRANHAAARLAAYDLHAKLEDAPDPDEARGTWNPHEATHLRAVHLVVSFGGDQDLETAPSPEEVKAQRQRAAAVLEAAGLEGYLLVYHPYRIRDVVKTYLRNEEDVTTEGGMWRALNRTQDEDGPDLPWSWDSQNPPVYISPHFHAIGFTAPRWAHDDCTPSPTCDHGPADHCPDCHHAGEGERHVYDQLLDPGPKRDHDGVRGVGPATLETLHDRYPTLEGLRSATISELEEVPGIGPATAAAVLEALEDTPDLEGRAISPGCERLPDASELDARLPDDVFDAGEDVFTRPEKKGDPGTYGELRELVEYLATHAAPHKDHKWATWRGSLANRAFRWREPQDAQTARLLADIAQDQGNLGLHLRMRATRVHHEDQADLSPKDRNKLHQRIPDPDADETADRHDECPDCGAEGEAVSTAGEGHKLLADPATRVRNDVELELAVVMLHDTRAFCAHVHRTKGWDAPVVDEERAREFLGDREAVREFLDTANHDRDRGLLYSRGPVSAPSDAEIEHARSTVTGRSRHEERVRR